ncbi:MAG: hypothetical protein MZV63_57645 [Marinilabiliales bacterium]|nr:hypothetical protein [Marinilabiliales bacterium]
MPSHCNAWVLPLPVHSPQTCPALSLKPLLYLHLQKPCSARASLLNLGKKAPANPDAGGKARQRSVQDPQGVH